MIYEPSVAFNLADDWDEYIGIPLLGAAILLVGDFLAGENKPWSYYLGVALGSMAVATGIPGAAAVMYVAGDLVDGLLFHSPEGSHVRLFLDGVQQADIFTYAATEGWEAFQAAVPDDGQVHQLAIVNMGVAPGNETGIAWMAIGGPITVTGTNPQVQGVTNMALAEFSFQMTDAVGNTASLNLKVDKATAWNVAAAQEFVTEFTPLLDAAVGGQITAATVTIPATLPGGLKATPDADSLADHVASLQYRLDNGAKRSLTLPMVDFAAVGARGTLIVNAAIDNLNNEIVNGRDIAGETASPVYALGTTVHDFTSFIAGKTY